jgi:cardiolipin synthase
MNSLQTQHMKFSFSFFKKLPPHEKRMTISTMLTIARILLVPIIILSMVLHAWGTAFLLFVAAAITDILDGALARLRNERTLLGAGLDPIADKFLVVSCFFTLGFMQTPLLPIPHWFVLIVLIKELILICGAFYLYFKTGLIEIQPTRLGKITTGIQVSFIAWLFFCYFFNWLPLKTFYGVLWGVVALVVASFVQYSRIGVRKLTS